MSLYLGSSAITGVYLGSTAVSKVYLGSTEVWAPAPSGAHYTDNFNRSNNASLGANWTSYDNSGLGTQFRVLSNTAAVSATGIGTYGFDQVLSEYNTALTTNNHKVSVTIGATKPFAVVLYLRSNSSAYVATSCIDGNPWSISGISGATGYEESSASTDLSSSTAGNESFAASDVLSFEASGSTYTLKRNGSTVLSVTDSAHSSWVDSSHRKVAISIASVSSASAAVDDFDAQDI